MKRHLPPTVLLAAGLTAGLLVGCSADDQRAEPPGRPVPSAPRIDLDPERYVLDYREGQGDASTGAMPSMSAEDGSGGVVEPMPQPLPPSIDEDNTFVDPGEHPFVAPAEQPSSTFGLDVDSGSITIARTFLTEGRLPVPGSVRVEEWVNALGSAQAAPSDGDLAAATDAARSPFAPEGTQLVRVGVAAREVADAERPPAHLTFVIDTSGSMDIRDRLGLVKASLGLLVLNLRDDDTISIVTYSDEAGVLLEPTPVADAQTIVNAIEDLQPGNSTNLEAGLRQGYAQAAAAFDPEAINAVVLASDGVANVGLTEPGGLGEVIQGRAEDGIHLVTVGYGMGNYNDHLMEQVADTGDGFYAYLDTFDQAERFFTQRLTSVLTVVARDAKAQVTFDPATVARYRLLGYENRALDAEDFDDAAVDAGEVGAGHRVTALYEVELVAGTAAGADLGAAAIRHRDDAGEQVTVTAPITAAGPEERGAADLQLAAAAAAFAQIVGQDPVAAERGTTLAAVRAVLEPLVGELPAEGLAGSVLTPAELLQLVDLAIAAG